MAEKENEWGGYIARHLYDAACAERDRYREALQEIAALRAHSARWQRLAQKALDG